MGSGSGGNYSGTGGSSQPYADTYKVVANQLQNDKKDPDIYNSSSIRCKKQKEINRNIQYLPHIHNTAKAAANFRQLPLCYNKITGKKLTVLYEG